MSYQNNYVKANELFREEKFTEAIKLYSQCIQTFTTSKLLDLSGVNRLNPDYPRIYSNRGKCHLKLKNYQAALDDVQTAFGLIVIPYSYPWAKVFPPELQELYWSSRILICEISEVLGDVPFASFQISRSLNNMKNPQDHYKRVASRMSVVKPTYAPYDEKLYCKATWKKTKMVLPDSQILFSSCGTILDKMYLFGGESVDTTTMLDSTNRMIVIDPIKNTCQKVKYTSTKNPSPRVDCSMVVYDYKLYLFGGDADDRYDSHIWCFNPKESAWIIVENKGKYTPPSLHKHSALLYHKKMIVYGGKDNKDREDYGDVEQFDFETNTWEKLFAWKETKNTFWNSSISGPVPDPRNWHMAFIVNDEMWVVYGGCDPSRTKSESLIKELISDYNYDDIWSFNLTSKTWKKYLNIPGPPPSIRLETSCCQIRNNTYLFGGFGNVGSFHSNNIMMPHSYLNDGFEFGRSLSGGNEMSKLEQPTEIKGWRMLRFEGDIPSFRAGHTLIPFNNRLYLIGGYTYHWHDQKGNRDIYELTIQEKRCEMCLKDGFGESIKGICGRCHKVWYCSQDCQKAHWALHKQFCY